MRWIPGEEVLRLLTPLEAIAGVLNALEGERTKVAHGGPRRTYGSPELPLLIMPGMVPGALGLKAITLAEGNPERGLPTIQGLVVLFDSRDGHLIGACDGPALTAARTAAIAGYATQVLATPDSETMLLVGAGTQAAFQVAAVAAVRPITRVLLWNRTPSRRDGLAATLAHWNGALRIETVSDLGSAAQEADVITLVTASTEPLLCLANTKPGCHVNAMGSYQPHRREVASDLVLNSVVFADTVEGCREEAGDLLIPARDGELDWSDVRPLFSADASFRSQRTLLKSVGSAIFDLSCAQRVMELAESTLTSRGQPAWPAIP
jgi:ornithine cyclodeaminase